MIDMDPLSVTASVIGIVTAAIQSVQLLATTIDNIKVAPNIAKSISADLRAVQPVLQNLDQALQNGSPQIILSSPIKHAVENCDKAREAFQSQIEHWTRHSTEEKTVWIDRWNIGLFGQERIKTFKAQLNDCKGTLNVALSTATIITASRQDSLMKEMKDMMLQQNELAVQRQIARADNEATEIERNLQRLTVQGSNEPSYGLDRSRQELLQELERQQATNTAFKEMCEDALSNTVYERTGQKIKGIKATNNSSALTGFINTSGEELKIDQDISDVTADGWSVAVAGVVKNVDFKDLRPGGPVEVAVRMSARSHRG